MGELDEIIGETRPYELTVGEAGQWVHRGLLQDSFIFLFEMF